MMIRSLKMHLEEGFRKLAKANMLRITTIIIIITIIIITTTEKGRDMVKFCECNLSELSSLIFLICKKKYSSHFHNSIISSVLYHRIAVRQIIVCSFSHTYKINDLKRKICMRS